jgi:hypothetical protein
VSLSLVVGVRFALSFEFSRVVLSSLYRVEFYRAVLGSIGSCYVRCHVSLSGVVGVGFSLSVEFDVPCHLLKLVVLGSL